MSEDLSDCFIDPPDIKNDWEAYQETGYFYYLAKCCAACLAYEPSLPAEISYGPIVPSEIAQALKRHLTEYCNAEDTKGAQKALGLSGGKDGGSSQFSRAKSDEKKRKIFEAVDFVSGFLDCSQDPPRETPFNSNFSIIAKSEGTTADYVKQVWYERKRSK